MVSAARKAENAARKMVSGKKEAAKTAKKQEAKAAAKGKRPQQDESAPKRKLGAMVNDAESSSIPTPAHRYDVHIKNSTITVSVTLHRVPPNSIDIDKTTDALLVLDTTKGAKPFHLEFPFPDGMKVTASKGEYELENGILRCTFPVTKMPESLVKGRQVLIEKVRADKRKRFDTNQDGELVVRTRKAKFVQEEELPKKAKRTEAPAAQAAPASDDDEEEDVPAPKATRKSSKTANKPSQSADAKKQYVADGDALEIAKSIGNAARQNLKQRVAEAKQLQQSRQQKLSVRTERKDVKAERKQAGLQRILEEQKARLLQKAELAAPAPKKAAAKDAKGKGKSVRFSS